MSNCAEEEWSWFQLQEETATRPDQRSETILPVVLGVHIHLQETASARGVTIDLSVPSA